MRKYRIKSTYKIAGVFSLAVGFYLFIRASIFLYHNYPYTIYYSFVVLPIGAYFVLTGILFNFIGGYYVEDDGISLKIWKFRLNKFKWKNMVLIEIRRRWGAVVELTFSDRKGNGKRFGEGIGQHTAFFDEILDKVEKHGGILIKELTS